MVYSTGDAQPTVEEQKPLVQQEGQEAPNPEQESQQPVQGSEKSTEVQELEQRLGYTTDQLGQQPQPEQQTQEEQKQEGQQLTPEMEGAIEQYLKSKFGVSSDEFQQQFQGLQQFREQQLLQQQQSALQGEWGNEYENRLGAVKEYFNNRLTPEQQQALDNADGAKLIWAKIAQEQQGNQPQPPNFQGGSQPPQQMVNQPSNDYWYTKSQLTNMGLEEYNKNIKNIEHAFAKGLVNYNA